MDLNLIWFMLLGVLLAGYAILDGFDLGVGIIAPLARTDGERGAFIRSIGPIWDGNEVWLITFGGALFAAFPEAYAAIFSGFYLPFMLLLLGLIMRAVSVEFRSKVDSVRWRRVCDRGFFVASTLVTLLFGVAVGNSVAGIPLDERGDYTGSFFDLLAPYPILIGLLSVALFAMHGTAYLCLKLPDGSGVQERVRSWMWHTWGVFLVLYMLASGYTLIHVEHAIANIKAAPWVVGLYAINALAVANVPRALVRGSNWQAFLSSSTVIATAVGLFGVAQWPNLVTSPTPETSLTIYNAASSPGTLQTMFVIACIGMPLVLTYTTIIYWTFRKRVTLDDAGY